MAIRSAMPKGDAKTPALFRALLPNDPRITVRPMFGHTAAFVNGQMFAGTFGTHVFARLDEPSRAEILAVPGAAVFAPMQDRPAADTIRASNRQHQLRRSPLSSGPHTTSRQSITSL